MRRWKPNKTQARAYAEKMREAEAEHTFIRSNGAIREGCHVEYVDKASAEVIKGEVVTSSYGANTGQHTFSIAHDGGLKKVKGRNLYDRLLKHTPGEISKEVSR